MERIESPQNPRLKAVARLRTSRGRARGEQFLIDGLRENRRALAMGWPIETWALCRDYLDADQWVELEEEASAAKIAIWDLSPAAFAKLAYGERVEGIVGIAKHRATRLADWGAVEPGQVYLVLEGIEKPGNLGAIFRTCDAMGVAGVLLCDVNVTPENPNAIRASLGTVFSVPFVVTDSVSARAWLTERKVRCFAAKPEGAADYWDVAYFDLAQGGERPAVALVMGSEAHGLTEVWDAQMAAAVRIPQAGIADSLNLSVATAVLLYEMGRQRRVLTA